MARKSKAPGPIEFGPVVRLLRTNGLRKGLFGGSRGWAAVAVGTWGYTTLRKLARRNVELVFSEELKPGERIIIANNRPTLDR